MTFFLKLLWGRFMNSLTNKTKISFLKCKSLALFMINISPLLLVILELLIHFLFFIL